MAESNGNKKRIQTLETLRGLSFASVMLTHSGLSQGRIGMVGLSGVSVFFMLSGFLSVYTRMERTPMEPSLRNNLRYTAKKIKKLYPLHVLMTLAMLLLALVGGAWERPGWLLTKLGLNLLLIQEWFPLDDRALNGVTWFLCTVVLFYLLFPWWMQRIRSSYTVRRARISILACIAIDAAVVLVSTLLPQAAQVEGTVWDTDLTYWLTDRFPPVRLVDMLIGGNLGYLYYCRRERPIRWATGKEALTLLYVLLATIAASRAIAGDPVISERLLEQNKIGWTYALLFFPSSMAQVYLFAAGQGKISKWLTGSLTLYLARLSSFGFLIHTVVYDYLVVVMFHIGSPAFGEMLAHRYGGWIKITVGVFLTLAASQIWIRLTGYRNKPRAQT